MIIFSYIFIFLTGAMILGSLGVVLWSRTMAIWLLAGAVLCGTISFVITSFALTRAVPRTAYADVRKAGEIDPEIDAAVQWVLEDRELTPAEYGQIAQIYREKTGKELVDIAKDRK